MATITTGIGLFSGLNYANLVDQLIAIEARPRNQIQARMSNIDAQRTAFMDISARITALLSRVTTLTKSTFFTAATATSSNPDVLTATVGENVIPGAYSFRVRSLATTQQLVSRGFSSTDAPVAAGTLTIESAAAKVNRSTSLDELNAFTGVQRGSFKIINGNGQQATIDIRDAQTIADVLDRINQAGIGVTAELRGEAILLKDTTGGSQGVRVREIGDGHTAADLGFGTGHTYSASGELLGSELMYLAGTTRLSGLNDGLGIRRAAAGGDFTIQSCDTSVTVTVKLNEVIGEDTRLERLNHARGVELGRIRITTKNKVSTEVDLTGAQTIGDVKRLIEQNVAGVSIFLAGGRLILSDTTNGTSSLTVEDVEGHAARDLGILGTGTGTKIDGKQVLHVDTIADVVAAINYGKGNQYVNGRPVIEASIAADGKRLVITDHGEGPFPSTIISEVEGSGSHALEDLGFAPGAYGSFGAEITGKRIIGGLDSVLLTTLNGGQGFTGGIIHIAANGVEADVDLSQSETLRDVIERINDAAQQSGLGIEAAYDKTGTRLLITNAQNESGQITISDVQGGFAAALGINTTAARIHSNNLQRQYISELTRLEDLNVGNGVALGKFRITTAAGQVAVVDLVSAGAKTLGDVINAINKSKIPVQARINDTGDGLVIIDNSGGSDKLKIREEGNGTTARDLNILGEFANGRADGSYEFKIQSTGRETLSDLMASVNKTTLATAHVVNDGSPVAPYRLSISALASGRAGELILDGGQTGLDFTTLTRAQDASVFLGDAPDGGVLITSSSNTISNIVDGLTLTLTGTDDQPVTVTVARNVESMVTTLKDLVKDFNSLLKRIDDLSSYNAETEEKGILFADGTLRAIETRLFRMVTGSVSGATGQLTRLSQVGVKLVDGQLTFDEQKFRDAYEQNPDEVNRFFTAAETGLAVQLKEQLDSMTKTGGLIKRRDTALQDQREMLADRVELLNALLARKRERLLRDFQTMEQTLSLIHI